MPGSRPAAELQGSPEVRGIARRFWETRLAQVIPIVERGQLPHGTSAAGVIEHAAAPLYHRRLVTGESLTGATADLAAAARAGVFTSA